MNRFDTLPPTHSLKHLAEISGPFPIKNQYLLLAAERFGFSERVIEFLKLFPAHEVFHSRDSFLQSCADLKNELRGGLPGRQEPVSMLKGAYYGYYPADTTHQTRVKGGWRNLFWSD